jgi:hypothetical protein
VRVHNTRTTVNRNTVETIGLAVLLILMVVGVVIFRPFSRSQTEIAGGSEQIPTLATTVRGAFASIDTNPPAQTSASTEVVPTESPVPAPSAAQSTTPGSDLEVRSTPTVPQLPSVVPQLKPVVESLEDTINQALSGVRLGL